jgi:hypothetical protein
MLPRQSIVVCPGGGVNERSSYEEGPKLTRLLARALRVENATLDDVAGTSLRWPEYSPTNMDYLGSSSYWVPSTGAARAPPTNAEVARATAKKLVRMVDLSARRE